ncbi:MAG TPA: acylphosphatase [Kofleriaceae bacterium]|nr:acylphosphatase [Kofleriaceae bacterium]
MSGGQAIRRVHARVRGRVQGVAYRASTRHEAQRLGLLGWVMNREDGSVELEAQGPSDVVEQLLTWCRRGPSLASVTSVDVTDLPLDATSSSFDIRR